MRFVRAIAAAFAIVLLLAPSAMACLTPDEQMTADEHDCCDHMSQGQDCGSMGTAQSQSCCKPEIRPAVAYVAVQQVEAHPQQIAPTAVLAPAAPAVFTITATRVCVLAHSPPPPDHSTILQI